MSVRNLSASAHSETSSISRVVRAAMSRVRWILAVRYGSRGLLAGTLCGLVYVALAKLRVLSSVNDRIALGMVAAGLVAGIAVALFWRLSDLQAARLTERRADLKERLSSALEFLGEGHRSDEPFFREQLEDAERCARDVNVASLFKFRLPRELPIALLLLLALAGIFYLPAIRMLTSAKHHQELAEVKRKGLAIIKLARDAQKNADQQKLDETKKAAMEAQKLGEAMAHNKLNKKQALVALAKLTHKMQETQKRLASETPKKSLDQAQKELKHSLDQMQKKVEEAQNKRAQESAQKNGQKMDPKQAQKMQQQQAGLKEQQSPAMKQAMQAMQQMQQAMANHNPGQMQKAMQQLAQQMRSGNMSQADMKQLQQALQQMSDAMKDTSMSKTGQQLSDMAQMMASNMDANSMQQMAAMMDQAAKDMGKSMGGDMGAMLDAKALAELEKALESGGMSGGNGAPGYGPGQHPGRGYGGTGSLTKAMKEMLNSKARLVAMGKNKTAPGKGKAGSAKEFAKYLAMKTAPSRYTPNGKVAGARSENGNELQMSMTGDPDSARSTSPYYQVYQTSKRQAENSLDKESIPATYKKQVRDYFESIRP